MPAAARALVGGPLAAAHPPTQEVQDA
jgi:hypothetical protein